MNCTFEQTDRQGVYRCSGCGFTTKPLSCDAHSIVRECKSPAAAQPAGTISPALWQKAVNFTGAVFAQLPLAAEAILTGDESKAFRNREEIEAIAATCRACPLFDGERCTHQSCGCPVLADRSVFWSKIAWKSQNCPDGRWT